jgi:HD-GYP domain-containing protein (c-di-GMP phosphodiesterase class II)
MNRITRKFIAFITIIILVLSGIIGWISYEDSIKIANDIILQTNHSELKNIRDYYFEKLIKDMEFIVTTWAKHPSIVAYDKKNDRTRYVTSIPLNFMSVYNQWIGLTLSSNDITWIYYALEQDGSIFIAPVDETMPLDYDARTREWYQGTVSKKGEVFWTEPYIDAGESNKFIQTVSKAVYEGDTLKGVVGLDIELNQFTKIIEDLSFAKSSTILLLNEQDFVLAHNSSDVDYFTSHFLSHTKMEPEHSVILKIDKGHYVLSWLPLNLNNWKIVAITKIDFSKNLINLQLKVAGLVAMATLVGIIFATFMSQKLLLPLKQLIDITKRVEQGDFEVRSTVSSKDEFYDLSLSFNQMLQRIETLIEELDENYLHTVKVLANAIEASDEYTRGHCDRVGLISLEIAQAMNLQPSNIKHLEFACVLHDIGKIAVPESILNKPNKLTKEEFEIIKKHPIVGFDMIKDIPFLKQAAEILLQHHERIDGKGYPNQLKGQFIIEEAKILAVADAYDAMSSFRVYRNAPLTDDEIIEELVRSKGTQLDAAIVDILITLLDKNRNENA